MNNRRVWRCNQPKMEGREGMADSIWTGSLSGSPNKGTWPSKSWGLFIFWGIFGYKILHKLSCWWHGCPKCYPDDEKVLGSGVPAKVLRERNEDRLAELKKDFDVEVYWECDIERMKEDARIIRNGATTTMKDFFEELPDSGHINLQEAFFGGRTEPWVMHASVRDQPGRTIKYKDFKSLYPYM